MHLQDAYYAEKSELGDGDAISYKAPPTNVFAYDVNTTAGLFTATAQSSLDDCTSGVWTVDATSTTTGASSVTYDAHTSSTQCDALTPNFSNIGKGTAAGGAGGAGAGAGAGG